MTSVKPQSDSNSSTAPNVLAQRPPVVPGESTVPEQLEKWPDQKPRTLSYHSVPRKSGLNAVAENSSEMHAPLGFEPEGKSSEGNSGAVSPNCWKWRESWQTLLNDEVGLNLFQKFLKQEDHERYLMLEFWLACKGLSNSKQEPQLKNKMMKAIHGRLFLKIQHGIGEELKKSITLQIKDDIDNNRLLSPSIYDEACREVERHMSEVMHPNFLNSDIYLDYIQKVQSECGIPNACDVLPIATREAPAVFEEHFDELPENISQPLPVVEEDKELSCSVSTKSENFYSRRKSAFHRSSADMTYAKFMNQYGNRSNSSRRLHNYSYNPVSRQDSELQSLSSDARTDSMSDLSFDEMSANRETYTYKRQLQRQLKQMKQNACLNQNSDKFALIPRSSNPAVRESAKPADPEVFARNLISKLEKVKKEREGDEIMKQKLNLLEDDYKASVADAGEQTYEAFAQKNEDECQEILDNHVSRVWSDKTPRRSPSIGTPVRPKSPDGRKGWFPHVPQNKIHLSATMGRVPLAHVGSGVKKKEKDSYSIFSFDSGNGTDPAEEADLRSRSLVKSKTMPEQTDQSHGSDFLGACQRGASKVWSSSRRTLTDSGVSMVSGGHVENVVTSPSPQFKEKLVSSWLSEADRMSTSFGRGPTCSVISEEKDSVASSSSKHKTRSGTSGYAHCLRNKTNVHDRGMSSSGVKSVLPGQPFVADPSMPPLPFHSVDTDTQLEETRRRLNEMGKLNRILPSAMTGSSHSGMYSSQTSTKTEIPPQRPTTLTRSSYRPSSEESSVTTVVYNFSDEEMPYLLKVPGNPITLKQFKEFMPKRGRYRYFFVTPCEDLENQPIQEEITDENDFLPLWKGKVNAQIRPIID